MKRSKHRSSPEVNDEFEGCEIRINEAHPMYQQMQVLKSHLRQLGFNGPENVIASSFIFMMEGKKGPRRKYAQWLSFIQMLLDVQEILIPTKDIERCADRVIDHINKGCFVVSHSDS